MIYVTDAVTVHCLMFSDEMAINFAKNDSNTTTVGVKNFAMNSTRSRELRIALVKLIMKIRTRETRRQRYCYYRHRYFTEGKKHDKRFISCNIIKVPTDECIVLNLTQFLISFNNAVHVISKHYDLCHMVA